MKTTEAQRRAMKKYYTKHKKEINEYHKQYRKDHKKEYYTYLLRTAQRKLDELTTESGENA